MAVCQSRLGKCHLQAGQLWLSSKPRPLARGPHSLLYWHRFVPTATPRHMHLTPNQLILATLVAFFLCLFVCLCGWRCCLIVVCWPTAPRSTNHASFVDFVFPMFVTWHFFQLKLQLNWESLCRRNWFQCSFGGVCWTVYSCIIWSFKRTDLEVLRFLRNKWDCAHVAIKCRSSRNVLVI